MDCVAYTLVQAGAEASLDYLTLEAYRLLYEAFQEMAHVGAMCDDCPLGDGLGDLSDIEALYEVDGGASCFLLRVQRVMRRPSWQERVWTVEQPLAQLRLIE